MNEQEIRQKQKDAMALRREIGDHEYRKLKSEKKRKEYRERQEKIKEALGEKYVPTQNYLPEAPKKRGCSVTLTVVDENGEYSLTWSAPGLMGSVMATKRGNGYLEMAKPVLERLYGKMT